MKSINKQGEKTWSLLHKRLSSEDIDYSKVRSKSFCVEYKLFLMLVNYNLT